jgi:hypothetical protein
LLEKSVVSKLKGRVMIAKRYQTDKIVTSTANAMRVQSVEKNTKMSQKEAGYCVKDVKIGVTKLA